MADRRTRVLLGASQLAAVLDALEHRAGEMHLPFATSVYQAAAAGIRKAKAAQEERREHERSNH